MTGFKVVSEACIDCGNEKIEANGRCASCAAQKRKEQRLDARPRKTYRMPKVSVKQKEALKTYAVKRKEHLKKHPYCQLKLQGCTNRATQVHHSAKRGINLNKEETFMSACECCHDQVERRLSAKERREGGFLK